MTDSSTEDFLEHFGVKGMKWGHRKEAETSDSPTGSSEKKQLSGKQKTAIILGTAAGVAAIAAGTYYVHKKMNLKVPVKDISVKPEVASMMERFIDSKSAESPNIIHYAQAKGGNLAFVSKGGLVDPLQELSKSSLTEGDRGIGAFARYGDKREKVAGIIADPLGRKDKAGRPVLHIVALPENLSKGVNNVEDLEKVAWPSLKDSYNAYYGLSYSQLAKGGKITKNEGE